MTVRDRLTAVAALAVLLASSSLWAVFDSRAWLPAVLGVVVVVALASALARRTRLPRVAVPVVPLLALVAYVLVTSVTSSLAYGVLPGREALRALGDLFTAAGNDLAQYGPPAPVTPGLRLLVVGGVGLVLVVVDALASLAQRPAAAGIPLLALFVVPSAVLPGGLGWVPFVLGAAGWLALLLVEGREEAARWGTALAAGRDGAGLGRVGRRIGGAALGVAVLVPALLPGLDARLLDGGDGSGDGPGGGRSVTTYNPMTRLRGDLSLPDPVTILRYTTNDPDPDYLRMTTLGVYDGSGWRQEVLRGNLRENGADDPLPAPVGRGTTVATRAVQAQVAISSLDAFWLPVPATPSAVEVDGPWMWDPGSESIFSTRSNTEQVEQYAVRSSRVLPDPAQMAPGNDPVPGAIEPYLAGVEATQTVRDLTARVVRGQITDYGRATALQAFFRNPANGFEYAEDTLTGGSPDALEDFLQQRQGFCEQYASAMAAMLRLAGVPARVAVGFTPGELQSDGSYAVTTDEAHAWPEAWFEGAGWVRFEPTPSQGGITPPRYGAPSSTPSAPTGPAPEASAAPGETLEDTEETPAERQQRLAEEAEAQLSGLPEDGSGGSGGGLPARELGIAGAVLVALASPALLHLARRRRRWRTPTPGVAWAQLQDDATDTGHDWSPAESPRATSARLVRSAGLSGPAADAVARLTEAVERERYARPGTVGADSGLADDSRTVRRALRLGVGRRQRLLSVLLPPSTLRGTSSELGSRTADLLDALDRLPATLAGRLRRRSA